MKISVKKIFKRLIWILLYGLLFILLITFLANYKINRSAKNLVYNDPALIPHNKVGLVLGTSKYLKSGQLNQYFANRMKAAAELFDSKKIKYIVVSGDNRKKEYNEPVNMKNELIKLGVPDSLIILDYAGFRTFDSVIRLNKIFGQTSFTVISQEFHNQRAIYIAKQKDLVAIGYNAKDVDYYNGFKTKLREKFARVKVFIDLILNKEPKFLGEKVVIE